MCGQDEKDVRYSSNSLVNAILHYKLKGLEIEKDKLMIKSKINDKLEVKNSDIAVIIGYALDNDIEALDPLKLAGRFLSLSIIAEIGTININIKNAYDKNYKKPGPHLGLGIASIEELSHKYHGYTEINKGRVFETHVCLMNEKE